jgi:hypothetical protein
MQGNNRAVESTAAQYLDELLAQDTGGFIELVTAKGKLWQLNSKKDIASALSSKMEFVAIRNSRGRQIPVPLFNQQTGKLNCYKF